LSSETTEKSDYQNLSFREFWKVLKWTSGIIHEIAPVHTTIFTITTILTNLNPLINTYLLSRIWGLLIELVQRDDASLSMVMPYFGILLGINLLMSIVRYLNLFSRRTIDIQSQYELDRILYKKLYGLGIQSLENPGISNKVSRASHEIRNMLPFYSQITNTIGLLAGFVVGLFILLNYAPILVPLILAFTIPEYLVDKKYKKISWKFGYENTEKSRKMGYTFGTLSAPSNLEEIHINRSFTFLDDLYKNLADWFAGERINLRKEWFKKMYTWSFVNQIGIYIGYLYIFRNLILKITSFADGYFQISIIRNVNGDLSRLFSNINDIFEVAIRIKDTHAFFMLDPAFPDGDIEIKEMDKGPEIKIQNVNFSYPNNDIVVLKNINLAINSGEKIAIVGHNGAGKTTLVKLLCRMYLPDSGNILINEVDTKNVKSQSLHKNMAVLFQDFNAYSQLTARENVIIGKPERDHTNEAVTKALEFADATEFVEKYPKGLEQILGERFEDGIRPSSGQWQKLALARFFYRDAPFVIFDEPTAAIDPVSEYKIFNKIYEFFQGKTVIIISHRFSTVRNADRIIVLANGEIIEQGTHKTLMENNGYYAEAFRMQAEGYSE